MSTVQRAVTHNTRGQELEFLSSGDLAVELGR